MGFACELVFRLPRVCASQFLEILHRIFQYSEMNLSRRSESSFDMCDEPPVPGLSHG